MVEEGKVKYGGVRKGYAGKIIEGQGLAEERKVKSEKERVLAEQRKVKSGRGEKDEGEKG